MVDAQPRFSGNNYQTGTSKQSHNFTSEESKSEDSDDSTPHIQAAGKLQRFKDDMSMNDNIYNSMGQLQSFMGSAHQLVQDNNGNFS